MSDLPPDAEPASPVSDRYTATPAPTFQSKAPVDPNDRYTATPAPVRQNYARPDGSNTLNYRPMANFSRPGSVTSAVVVTWCLLGVYAVRLGIGFVDAVIGANHPASAFGGADVPNVVGDLFATIAIILAMMLAWVAAAFALSILAFSGRQWARIALVISGGVSVPFQLFSGIILPIPLIFMFATIAVMVVLFTPEANDWYRRMS